MRLSCSPVVGASRRNSCLTPRSASCRSGLPGLVRDRIFTADARAGRALSFPPVVRGRAEVGGTRKANDRASRKPTTFSLDGRVFLSDSRALSMPLERTDCHCPPRACVRTHARTHTRTNTPRRLTLTSAGNSPRERSQLNPVSF